MPGLKSKTTSPSTFLPSAHATAARTLKLAQRTNKPSWQPYLNVAMHPRIAAPVLLADSTPRWCRGLDPLDPILHGTVAQCFDVFLFDFCFRGDRDAQAPLNVDEHVARIDAKPAG